MQRLCDCVSCSDWFIHHQLRHIDLHGSLTMTLPLSPTLALMLHLSLTSVYVFLLCRLLNGDSWTQTDSTRRRWRENKRCYRTRGSGVIGQTSRKECRMLFVDNSLTRTLVHLSTWLILYFVTLFFLLNLFFWFYNLNQHSKHLNRYYKNWN